MTAYYYAFEDSQGVLCVGELEDQREATAPSMAAAFPKCIYFGVEPPVDPTTLVHGINYRDHEIACALNGYEHTVLITDDADKLTCEDCRRVLVSNLNLNPNMM